MPALPLDGIRVVDLTVVWSGPAAGRYLAALGAEVVRVESIRHFPATSRGQVPTPTARQWPGPETKPRPIRVRIPEPTHTTASLRSYSLPRASSAAPWS